MDYMLWCYGVWLGLVVHHFFKFRLQEIDPDFDPGKEVAFYSHWVTSVVGPVVYIVAVVHALLWRQLSGTAGSIVSCQYCNLHDIRPDVV